MNLNIKLSEEQMMERQQNIARLKENEWIQIFLEQNHLDASFVEENSGVLLQWIKSVSACRNCKGLDYCVQRIRGKATKLKIDDSGFLNIMLLVSMNKNEISNWLIKVNFASLICL